MPSDHQRGRQGIASVRTAGVAALPSARWLAATPTHRSFSEIATTRRAATFAMVAEPEGAIFNWHGGDITKWRVQANRV